MLFFFFFVLRQSSEGFCGSFQDPDPERENQFLSLEERSNGEGSIFPLYTGMPILGHLPTVTQSVV